MLLFPPLVAARVSRWEVGRLRTCVSALGSPLCGWRRDGSSRPASRSSLWARALRTSLTGGPLAGGGPLVNVAAVAAAAPASSPSPLHRRNGRGLPPSSIVDVCLWRRPCWRRPCWRRRAPLDGGGDRGMGGGGGGGDGGGGCGHRTGCSGRGFCRGAPADTLITSRGRCLVWTRRTGAAFSLPTTPHLGHAFCRTNRWMPPLPTVVTLEAHRPAHVPVSPLLLVAPAFLEPLRAAPLTQREVHFSSQ